MSEATSAAMRQTALLVHGMSGHDRDWMLSQLPGAQATAVRQLLEELQQLGIPSDAALLNQAISSPMRVAVKDSAGISLRNAASGDAYEKNVALLAEADAQLVLEALKMEPPLLIAKLLQMHAWPWRDLVLEQIGITKRRQIADLLHGESDADGTKPVHKNLYAETLVSLLSNRLADLSVSHQGRPDQGATDKGVAEGNGRSLGLKEIFKKITGVHNGFRTATRGIRE